MGCVGRKGYRRGRVVPLLLALLLGGAALAVPERPAADDDGEWLRERIEARDIVPFDRLLERIRESFDGRVLKLELEYEGSDDDEDDDGRGGWVYEVKMLTPAGNVLKILYDAKTMELLAVKGRRGDGGRREWPEDDD